MPIQQSAMLPMKPGLTRFTWDFRTGGLQKIPNTFVLGADYRGHRVAQGNYKARMSYGEESSTVDIVILDPPDISVSKQAWSAQQSLIENIEGRINELHKSINSTMEMNGKIKSILKQIGSSEGTEDLKDAG